jgi:hypothetical protein
VIALRNEEKFFCNVFGNSLAPRYVQERRASDMTRKAKFNRRYPTHAATVLKSIARVAVAGRWGDKAKIETERARHKRLMASLPQLTLRAMVFVDGER